MVSSATGNNPSSENDRPFSTGEVETPLPLSARLAEMRNGSSVPRWATSSRTSLKMVLNTATTCSTEIAAGFEGGGGAVFFGAGATACTDELDDTALGDALAVSATFTSPSSIRWCTMRVASNSEKRAS
ncbi:MAG: hypothetical protein QM817_02250 [Archangium sp.]